MSARSEGKKVLYNKVGGLVVHGSADTYQRHRCRCDECRTANTAKVSAARTRRIKQGVPAGVKHGVSTAVNHGCHCDVCTQAIAERNRLASQERRNRPLAADDKRHGTVNGYVSWWCRCEACLNAMRRYKEERKGIK